MCNVFGLMLKRLGVAGKGAGHMSAGTKIEWADASWQTITGCTPISKGCANCYAEKMTRRLQAMGQMKYAAGFDKVVCHPEALKEPFLWKKPKRIFVNSMADTFHKDVPDDFIQRIFAVAAYCEQHTFMFLTKRAELMFKTVTKDIFRERVLHKTACFYEDADNAHDSLLAGPWPLPNVWLGVTVESEDQLDRIEWLKKTPAAVKFISFEPLLKKIKHLNLKGIHWVIVGAETGPYASLMDMAWAVLLREQARAESIPFFMKKCSKGEVIPEHLNVREFPRGYLQ